MKNSMTSQSIFEKMKRRIAGVVAGVFFLTNVTGLYATESSFWAERRRATQGRGVETGAPIQLASATNFAAQLPQANPFAFGGVTPTAGGGLDGTGSSLTSSLPRPAGLTAQQDWLIHAVAPYGTIQEARFASAKAPLIVHIQDAHGIWDAQRNTASLILELQKSRNIQLVGLEGASGAFRTEAYRSLSDLPTMRLVASDLLSIGMVGGPEYAGLVADKAPLLWGVENLADYHANIDAYKQAAKGAAAFKSRVAGFSKAVDSLKPTLYSPALREFDRIHTRYRSHSEGLGSYVTYLLGTASGQQAKVPQLHRLNDALIAESRLDFKVVESERRLLVESLAKKMSAKELEGLVQQSVLFRGGRLNHTAFHSALTAAARQHGIRLESYPQFKAYMGYVESAERIQLGDLFKELTTLEARVQSDLATGEKEKSLLAASQAVVLLEKLGSQSMSPLDWADYETRRPTVLALGATLRDLAKGAAAPVADWPEMETALKPFEDFCRYASARNEGLTQNLLEKMRESKSAGAVLVAGGFHTDGLVKMFKAKDLSYVVVTPKIKEVPKENHYLEAFTRDPRPLEKILSGERIFLVTPPNLAASSPAQGQATADRAVAADLAVRTAANLPAGQVPQALTELGSKLNAVGGAQFSFSPIEGKTVVAVTVTEQDGTQARFTAQYAPTSSFEADVLNPLRRDGTITEDASGQPGNYYVMSLAGEGQTPISVALYQTSGSQENSQLFEAVGRLLAGSQEGLTAVRSATTNVVSGAKQSGFLSQKGIPFALIAIASISIMVISGSIATLPLMSAVLSSISFVVFQFFPDSIKKFILWARPPSSPWVDSAALDKYFQEQLLALLNSRRNDLEDALIKRSKTNPGTPARKTHDDNVKKIVDEINALPAEEGEFGEGVEGDELARKYSDFKESNHFQQYHREAAQLLLNGRIAFQLYFAGAATRLGLGPMMLVDLVQVAEAILEIPNMKVGPQKRNEILNKWDAFVNEETNKILRAEAAKIGEDYKKYHGQNFSRKKREINANFKEKMRAAYNKIPGPEGNKKERGIAGRHLLAKAQELEQIAIKNRVRPETVLAKTPLVIHVNDAIWDDVKKDLIANNFYGFNPDNIMFIFSPFVASHEYIDGELRVKEDSEALPTGGHLSAAARLYQPGEVVRLSAEGKKSRPPQSAERILRSKHVREVVAHRINDLTMFTPESLDINRLAYCLYSIRENGHGLVAELVANPDLTKGGNLIKKNATRNKFLIETMNAANAFLQKLLTEMSKKAAPYNAFRFMYSLDAVGNAFRRGGFRVNLRYVPDSGTFNVENPAGDLTQQPELAPDFFQVGEDTVINDFKILGHVTAGLEAIAQEETPLFNAFAERITLQTPYKSAWDNGWYRYVVVFLLGVLFAALLHDFVYLLGKESWFPNILDLLNRGIELIFPGISLKELSFSSLIQNNIEALGVIGGLVGMTAGSSVRSALTDPDTANFRELLKKLEDNDPRPKEADINAVVESLMRQQNREIHAKKWKAFYRRLLTAEDWDQNLPAAMVEAARRVAYQSAAHLASRPDNAMSDLEKRNLYAMGYIARDPAYFQERGSVPTFSANADARLQQVHAAAIASIEKVILTQGIASDSAVRTMRAAMEGKSRLNDFRVLRVQLTDDQFSDMKENGLDVSSTLASNTRNKDVTSEGRLTDVSPMLIDESNTILLRVPKGVDRVSADQIFLVDTRQPWKDHSVKNYDNPRGFFQSVRGGVTYRSGWSLSRFSVGVGIVLVLIGVLGFPVDAMAAGFDINPLVESLNSEWAIYGFTAALLAAVSLPLHFMFNGGVPPWKKDSSSSMAWGIVKETLFVAGVISLLLLFPMSAMAAVIDLSALPALPALAPILAVFSPENIAGGLTGMAALAGLAGTMDIRYENPNILAQKLSAGELGPVYRIMTGEELLRASQGMGDPTKSTAVQIQPPTDLKPLQYAVALFPDGRTFVPGNTDPKTGVTEFLTRGPGSRQEMLLVSRADIEKLNRSKPESRAEALKALGRSEMDQRKLEDEAVRDLAPYAGKTANVPGGVVSPDVGADVNDVSDARQKAALAGALIDNLGAMARVSDYVNELTAPHIAVSPLKRGFGIKVNGDDVSDLAEEMDPAIVMPAITPAAYYHDEAPYGGEFQRAVEESTALLTKRVTEVTVPNASLAPAVEAMGYSLGHLAASGMSSHRLTRIYGAALSQFLNVDNSPEFARLSSVFSAALEVGRKAEIYSASNMSWLTHLAPNADAEVMPTLHVTEESRAKLGETAVRVARGLAVKQKSSTLLVLSDNRDDIQVIEQALADAELANVKVLLVPAAGDEGVLASEGDMQVFQEAKFFTQLTALGMADASQRAKDGNLVFPIVSEATNLDLSQVSNKTVFMLARLIGPIVMIIRTELDQDMKSLRKALEAA